ncbi:hypothetical protein H312_00644 [Anncaliia algerae PRA339]|uniref:Uncharacterized protein n=1 Tax=Anncaliia algerae PRA339 TaxID=1288291 RepID=A0A059F3V0_9MICR|nr:hypothetical protein H312_00644 [Anncaliia algerae PRA339]
MSKLELYTENLKNKMLYHFLLPEQKEKYFKNGFSKCSSIMQDCILNFKKDYNISRALRDNNHL